MRYASSAIELQGPRGGESWPVGARRTIAWDGQGRADVFLSTNGGLTYEPLATDVEGGSYRFTVPDAASTSCKVKVERHVPYSVSVSDSLFSIQSSVMLMTFSAQASEEGGPGVMLSWSTNPGPEDLLGYRVERGTGSGWATIVPTTRATTARDPNGEAGSRYRLYAINGLGDELLIGETALAAARPLSAWPLPYRDGALQVAFATYGGLGGGTGEAEVGIYDLSGRLVRELAHGSYQAGVQRVLWDGRGGVGVQVPNGVYFIRSVSAGHAERLKVVVMR
jgi:hypothetical protein